MSWAILGTSFKQENMGPFGEKKVILINVDFMHISKNWSTLKIHISLNFNPQEGVLGIFRNLMMSSKQPLWFHLNWIFNVHVRSFDPKGVFVDFSKGPIM